ncbi:leucine-rich repeat receptor protein kinase HPCA1-like isoform X2 [Alnus glutinosa]|uniref:leucine-rich repeat receptor protein kinase HPCA1-like isoform X2 n=1 Tax=Alnus glutinosa TaxID=3517 RepID=UPI002D79D426|nr:leucine-rich repeat receptor protein kinase HPCA1-like isoform X2 [Alnus glutinosa]
MGQRTQLILLLLLFIPYFVMESTASDDYNGLLSVKDELMNTPPNWVRPDPCGSKWDGIVCNNSRVTSLQLQSMNLSGRLSREIESLSELQILDLSYNKYLTGPLPPSIGSLKKLVTLNLIGCGFSGSIPDTIGNLQQLTTLSLTNNSFSGPIPASIGILSNLYWLDLAVNQLNGPIPVSPGLDNLLHAKHFHLESNKFSGEIPPQLFSSNMILLHLILNGNNLSGSIPETIGSVQTLEVIRFDRNSLSGTLPSNLSNLVYLNELYLSNNKFTGSIPNLTGLSLTYVDMSNNSFTVSDMPPWFSTLQSLATLVMENTQLQGPVPSSIFSLPNLQTVTLRNNNLSGTLDIGTSYSSKLQLVDLQNNSIVHEVYSAGGYNKNLILVHNPICNPPDATKSYCAVSQSNTPPYSTPSNHSCPPAQCTSDQISSPNCQCAYAYSGTLVFRAPNFLDLGISSYYLELQSTLMQRFKDCSLPVDSVSLRNPIKDSSTMNLNLSLDVFPSGQDHFNRTEILNIGSLFSSHTFTPPTGFGSYYFLANPYGYYAESKKSLSIGVIIGAVAGFTILLLLLVLAGVYVYALRQKRRAESASGQLNPFAHWDPNNGSGGIPQLKGARSFSFEELKKYTNKFSEANSIGSGGYGKVYRGILPAGQLIAIKRAHTESMQGGVEFKTEIELLSRVHHKNLVSLVGFCFDQGEQMLVYEYVPNGTLMDGLSGKSGIRLDWIRRLKVALGAARGLAYLHELANPPIIHRDIKSTNILLDERLNAKVADFGLSKLMGDAESGHVTTQVKGTMGYLDPEYYTTQQLTEKSDVYGFGVVLLELITARMPIERGKYIVMVVQTAMDRTKVLYNLHEILDPAIGLQTSLKGLEKFVDLAMRCVEESGANRPTMGMVVKEIENIMELAGLNPNAESATTSESYDINKENSHHPYSNEGFEYSGVYPTSKIEPQ